MPGENLENTWMLLHVTLAANVAVRLGFGFWKFGRFGSSSGSLRSSF